MFDVNKQFSASHILGKQLDYTSGLETSNNTTRKPMEPGQGNRCDSALHKIKKQIKVQFITGETMEAKLIKWLEK